ncbi:hypothetical protein PAMP_008886 [Pampus punctatissimus]
MAVGDTCKPRRCSKSKPDYNSSPYSSGDTNQPWPTGITPIPRATTNWDAAPPIEMTEGGSPHSFVNKKHQINGLNVPPSMLPALPDSQCVALGVSAEAESMEKGKALLLDSDFPCCPHLMIYTGHSRNTSDWVLRVMGSFMREKSLIVVESSALSSSCLTNEWQFKVPELMLGWE